jgi:hypothetical protein
LQFLFKNLDEKPYCVKAFVNKMLEVGARVKHRKWAEQACGVSIMEILQIVFIRVVSEMRALLCPGCAMCVLHAFRTCSNLYSDNQAEHTRKLLVLERFAVLRKRSFSVRVVYANGRECRAVIVEHYTRKL